MVLVSDLTLPLCPVGRVAPRDANSASYRCGSPRGSGFTATVWV